MKTYNILLIILSSFLLSCNKPSCYQVLFKFASSANYAAESIEITLKGGADSDTDVEESFTQLTSGWEKEYAFCGSDFDFFMKAILPDSSVACTTEIFVNGVLRETSEAIYREYSNEVDFQYAIQSGGGINDPI